MKKKVFSLVLALFVSLMIGCAGVSVTSTATDTASAAYKLTAIYMKAKRPAEVATAVTTVETLQVLAKEGTLSSAMFSEQLKGLAGNDPELALLISELVKAVTVEITLGTVNEQAVGVLSKFLTALK